MFQDEPVDKKQKNKTKTNIIDDPPAALVPERENYRRRKPNLSAIVLATVSGKQSNRAKCAHNLQLLTRVAQSR